MISNGGPGVSNIASDPLWRARLAPALEDHDLLAIDHRGIGASAAIDCPALQHVQGNQLDAARACGDEPRRRVGPLRLGRRGRRRRRRPRRARHRQDRLLRRLLRRGRRARVRVPARRPPARRRSSTRRTSRSDDAFFRTLPGAMAKITVRVCQRSPACSAGEKHPAKTLAALDQARALAAGDRHRLSTPPASAHQRQGRRGRRCSTSSTTTTSRDPAFLNQGEIFAAARALDAGDKTPLLRLAAESNAPPDFGDRRRRAVGRRRLRRVLRRQRVPVGQVRARGDAPRAVRGGRQGGAATRRPRRSRSRPGRASSPPSRCC